MEYSVDDLSKLANVSVRTLHYYDEIGLVKPALRLASGKRFYGVEQLMKLLDVVFFNRIGFSLEKIKTMLKASNVDKTALMKAKKQFLQKEIDRMKDLIKIIDKTEFYLEGKDLDKNEIVKLFDEFQKNTNEYKEMFEKEFGSFIDEEAEKVKKMSIEEQKEYYENLMSKVDKKLYMERCNSCMKKLIEAINNDLKEDSKEVQKIMQEYFESINMLKPISKKDWLTMAVSIGEDMDLYAVWAKMHPKMPEYFAKAVMIYGENLEQ